MSSHQYHRNTDPETSRMAAERLNLTLQDSHLQILRILSDLWKASDDQIASEAVNRGVFERHEQARRAIRTIRDKKNPFIVAALDPESGWQESVVNDSGNAALAWTLSVAGQRYVLETPLSA